MEKDAEIDHSTNGMIKYLAYLGDVRFFIESNATEHSLSMAIALFTSSVLKKKKR